MKVNKFFLRLFLIIAITLTVVVNTIVIWGIIKSEHKTSLTATINIGEVEDEVYGTRIEQANIELRPFFIKILISFNIIMLLVIIYDLKRIAILKKFENKIEEIKDNYKKADNN